MLSIPIQPLPSQTVTVQLANQTARLSVYQKSFGLFIDVYRNGELTIAGVIAQNRNLIIRSAYLGFTGDFAFLDTQGDVDPIYTGLGTRFLLVYLEESDLAVI